MRCALGAVRIGENGMKSILDKSFAYVPSHATDLRRTFARVKREQKAAARTPQEAADKARIAILFETRRVANTKETA